ncbi:hypothetical protein QBC44DRAFT_310507 [Cladorrhinum sp. PSN332]|nr:hypothetical protein QBC44DRAFT_310507 [Cladorrhinum sp. PSN332]
MRFFNILALASHALAAALTANTNGIIVSVNADGQTLTVPVLSADYYAPEGDDGPKHALRISPISDEDAAALLISGQGVAPATFEETITLDLAHSAPNGTQFLVTADDSLVPELLSKRQTEVLDGAARRDVATTSSDALMGGQSLVKRAWGCKCCQGCFHCGRTFCCWDVCCLGWTSKENCERLGCPWENTCTNGV